jgi:hypothetical protein
MSRTAMNTTVDKTLSAIKSLRSCLSKRFMASWYAVFIALTWVVCFVVNNIT